MASGSSSARLSNFLPLPDGRYLKAPPGRTKAEIAKFSARDAGRLAAYEARLERLADVLRALALKTPPNLATGQGIAANLAALARYREGRKPPAFARARRAARSGRALHPLGRRLSRPMVRERSDQGDPRLRRDRRNLRQPLCARAQAYVLLHHCWGEVNGRRGVWGHAIGGMGAITQAMARACAARGVEIRTGRGREILVEKGRAAGVVTAEGEKIAARAVVSNLHPKLTFERLLDPGRAARRFSRPHRLISQRLGLVPHEPRALRAAELLRPAGTRAGRASWERNRDRAEPRLYGARLFRRARSRAGRRRRSSKC